MIERINGVVYADSYIEYHYHVIISKRVIEKAKLISSEWNSFLSYCGYKNKNEPRNDVMCFFSITLKLDHQFYLRPIHPVYTKQQLKHFVDHDIGNVYGISLIEYLSNTQLTSYDTIHKSYSPHETFMYMLDNLLPTF